MADTVTGVMLGISRTQFFESYKTKIMYEQKETNSTE